MDGVKGHVDKEKLLIPEVPHIVRPKRPLQHVLIASKLNLCILLSGLPTLGLHSSSGMIWSGCVG